MLICTLCAFVFLLIRSNPDPENVLSNIPIGSTIEILGDLERKYDVRGGEVVQWIPISQKFVDRTRNEDVVKTRFGMFKRKILGNYLEWHPHRSGRESFTGVISVYLDRHFEGLIALEFTYVKGVLVKKDYGYFPG